MCIRDRAKDTCASEENLYLNNIKKNAKSNNKKTEMEFIGLDLLKILVIIACFCIFALIDVCKTPVIYKI